MPTSGHIDDCIDPGATANLNEATGSSDAPIDASIDSPIDIPADVSIDEPMEGDVILVMLAPDNAVSSAIPPG